MVERGRFTPRHWRLNPQRYRLQGFVNDDGTVSLQKRGSSVKKNVAETSLDTNPVISENKKDQKK